MAQTSSAQKPDTISGRVVNESGRPLPNATVVSRRMGLMDPGSASTTTTDGEGKFELSGLQPGGYHVLAYLQGYVQQLRTTDDTQASLYYPSDSVSLVLTKGGAITGTVTNQAGEPMVGANVRAQMVHAPSFMSFAYPYNPFNTFSPSDLTDDRGIYRIYGLPEGTYVVVAGGGSGLPYSTNLDPFENDVPTYAPASTRDTAREFIVRAGAEVNGVDIHYRGGSGHAVSGSARGTPGNQPLPFSILLISASGHSWMTKAVQDVNDRSFIVHGVDDGDYAISAVSQRPDGEFMASGAKEIKVRGADVTGVELIVQPLSSVAGRVVLEEIKTTDCSDKQRPVFTETFISAQSDAFGTRRSASMFLASIANPDEQGNVLLKNLAPDRYYFGAQYLAPDWYLKSISVPAPETMKGAKSLDAARTWTTLKPGERLNGLTITLAHGAASLRGHIALSEGETLGEKLHVYLVPAEKETADNPLRFYSGPVTAEGKVGLNNLAPGRYLVLAQGSVEESASTLAKLRSPDETAYRMKLRRQAETLKTEIELKPCQKVADLKVRMRPN